MSMLMFFARGAAMLAAALVLSRVLRRSSSALRATVLAAAFAAVLAVPLVARLVPAWHTGAPPAAEVQAVAAPYAERAVGAAVTAADPYRPAQASVLRPAVDGDALRVVFRALFAIWAFGAAALVSRAVVGEIRARRLAGRGRRLSSSHARVAWGALGGRGRAPRVVESDEVDAPIVVGALAPVVVVPASARDWDAARWRVVLLHELAHVRRRDGLANLVAQLACAVHWIDPLAHVARRTWRALREEAADDAVLRDGGRASSYAEHLLCIAADVARPVPAAALAMTDASRLEARIEALFADRPRAAAGRRAFPVALGAFVAATLAAGFAPESIASPADNGGKARPGAKQLPPASVVPALQTAAEEELDHALVAHPAAGAIAIVLDAKTGTILAQVVRGTGDVRATRIQGSVMKPFTFAAALDAGAVTLDAKIDCEHGKRSYGAKTMEDATPRGVLDLGGVLAVSSNIGTAKVAEPLGDKLGTALRSYNLPAPAHIDTRSFEGASIAGGEGTHASALQVASAYTMFASDGVYRSPDGSSARVMTAATARAVDTMLARVVDDADGTGKAARIPGVHVIGKTGTANTDVKDRNYASFAGIVPANAPRFVILVSFIEVDGQGGSVAAPAFAALATRLLAPAR